MPKATLSERLAEWGAALTPRDVPKAMAAKTESILVDVVGRGLAARRILLSAADDVLGTLVPHLPETFSF